MFDDPADELDAAGRRIFLSSVLTMVSGRGGEGNV
jgi:hypothetical protein